MQHIIFINRFYYPDHSATSQLLTDLSTELARTGKKVTVVTSRNCNDDNTVQLDKNELYKNVEIHRILTTSFTHLGLVGRALDYVSFYVSAFFKLLILARKNDILVAKTDPPLMSILVRMAGSLKQAKTVNWLQDIFPEIAEQLGLAPRGYGLGRLLRGLRNWSLRYADANVVLGQRMRNRLLALNIPDEKIFVFPNWANERLVRPVQPEDNPLIKDWSLENKFVIGYSGNLGRAHEFETIVEAAKRLSTHQNIVFLIIGRGVKSKALEAEVEKLCLNNFLFKEYQKKEQLKNSLSLPDVHLAVLSENMEGLIVPSKFYGIAAAGRPTLFIGDKRGEIASEIDRSNCGFNFSFDESKELAEKIKFLADNPEITRGLGSNASKLYQSRFKLRHAVASWEWLCGSISSSKRVVFISRDVIKKPSV